MRTRLSKIHPMRHFISFLLLLLVSAHAIAAKPIYQLPNPERLSIEGTSFEGKATVYVFRGGNSQHRPFNLSVDKVILGQVRQKSYLRFGVSGETHVLLGSPLMEGADPSAAISAAFDPGKTYYFTLETDFIILPSGMMEQKTSLLQIDASTAEKLVGTYKERPLKRAR